MRRVLAGAIVAIVMVPAIAAAETARGFYLGPKVGWAKLQAGGISGDLVSLKAEYNSGIAAMGVIGYAHPSGLRFEIEGGYRSNDVEQITAVVGGPLGLPVGVPLPASGKMQSASAMANAYYDFDLGLPVSPFIGAGIGVAGLYVEVTVPGFGQPLQDADLVYAYQGTAGASFMINSWVVVDLAYTYFMTAAPMLDNLPLNAVESEYKTHNLMAGLRVIF